MKNVNGNGGSYILSSNTGNTGDWEIYDDMNTLILNQEEFNIPGRVVLASSEINPNTLYAALGSGYINDFGFNYSYGNHIIKTSNNGITWELRNIPNITDNNWATLAWHALDIEVDPSDENVVYIGGLDLYKSNDSCLSWEKLSDSYKVVTDKGDYFSEKLIFSSGAWIKNLLPIINIPVKTERQVLLWFEPKKDKELFLNKNLPNTGWDLENGLEFYTQPIIESKGFKVAMHHNGKFISPDNLLRESNKDDIDIIRGFLEEYIPSANGELIDTRVCIYTDTPDYDFILDRHPEDDNIIICSPCSGHGFKFTPAIGEICSNMIVGQNIQYDLSEFSLSRFYEI